MPLLPWLGDAAVTMELEAGTGKQQFISILAINTDCPFFFGGTMVGVFLRNIYISVRVSSCKDQGLVFAFCFGRATVSSVLFVSFPSLLLLLLHDP